MVQEIPGVLTRDDCIINVSPGVLNVIGFEPVPPDMDHQLLRSSALPEPTEYQVVEKPWKAIQIKKATKYIFFIFNRFLLKNMAKLRIMRHNKKI